jgi:very-short-patch-repair endonuclease
VYVGRARGSGSSSRLTRLWRAGALRIQAGQAVLVDATAAIERLGGVAETRSLLRLTTRRRLRRALRDGRILQLSRGRFTLPAAEEAHRRAGELFGVVSLRSAAAHYGWEMKLTPPEPEITVRRNRNLSSERREGVRILWADLNPDDVRHGVTTPLRTVVDCARHLPFDEALAIVDSALRSALLTNDDLHWAIVRGAGAAGVRRVFQSADRRSANPFESVLRALCIEAGLQCEPQAAIDLGTGTVHPDLVDRERRLVLEADSWTFHAQRKAHTRDCARYNLLVLRGWRVLRFTWEQVNLDQAYVRWVLSELRRVERDEPAPDLAASA